MASRVCTTEPVKWGRTCEIDYRTRPATAAWKARHELRVQKLSAWRRMHMFGGHRAVLAYAKRRGVKNPSRMQLKTMIRAAESGLTE